MEYKGNSYPAEEFEWQFNPRQAVPDVDEILAQRPILSEASRARLTHELDHHYGDGEREVIDVFPAAGGGPSRPSLILRTAGDALCGQSFFACPSLRQG